VTDCPVLHRRVHAGNLTTGMRTGTSNATAYLQALKKTLDRRRALGS
jgi:hypothetical protein